MDRYIVISADCHAGADLLDYRPYLESRFHDEFDRWADAFVNPFGDLERPDADRNWDSARRTADLEADGVVAEVVYPNTVPPFFPSGNLVATSPTADDFAHRLAGLRAHNRWMAEWCAEQPERRAGIGQILLNDVDEAVARRALDRRSRPARRRAAARHPAGLADPAAARARSTTRCGGRARSGASWSTPTAAAPRPTTALYPASLSMWLMEVAWYSHRPLWSFVMSGVFDRFPGLRLVLAEQGIGWVRDALDTMDTFYAQIADGNVGELHLRAAVPARADAERVLGDELRGRRDRSCTATTASAASAIGVDKIMWGSDYPHLEGTPPFSKEAIALTFAGVARVGGRGHARRQRRRDLRVRPRRARTDRRRGRADRRRRGRPGSTTIPEGVTSPAFSPRMTPIA